MNQYQKFVNTISRKTPSTEIGKEYCNLFLTEGKRINGFSDDPDNKNLRNKLIRPISDMVNLKSFESNNNFSVATDNSSLNFLTKRLVLISDKVLITHPSQKYIPQYGRRDIISSIKYNKIRTSELASEGDFITKIREEILVNGPGFTKIGEYVRQCKELIQDETLIYLPNFQTISTRNVELSDWPNSKRISSSWVDAVMMNKKIAEIKTQNLIKSKYLFPIVDINLPIIDNADLRSFSTITSDEKSQINSLRIFLREKFLDIDHIQESETYYSDIEKIGLEIEKNINLIKSDFKSLSRKRAFQLSGSTVASIVATLVAADKEIFDMLGQILGTSGGVYLFFESFKSSNLEKKKIQQNPTYYFWLLSKKIQKI